LLDKINAFVFELDRARMPLQKFHDVILSLATTGAETAEKAQSSKCCACEFFSLRRSTQNETSGQVTMLPRRRSVRTIRLPRKRGTGSDRVRFRAISAQ
jgi:hypothetical protein